MSEPTYGKVYGEELQRMIVAMLVLDNVSFLIVKDIIKPEYFQNPILQDLVRLILNFAKQYGRGPVWEELLQELDIFLRTSTHPLPAQEYHDQACELLKESLDKRFDYVRDRVIQFAQFQGVRNAIVKSLDLLEEDQDYAGILAEVKKAVAIGESAQDLGSFYREETEARLMERKAGGARKDLAISTGLGKLDQRLGGGIVPGELGIILGPTKRGKTITLVNFGRGALYARKNVLHVGMEGSQMRTQALYDSCLTGVPKDSLCEREDEVRTELAKFFGEMKNSLIIKHFPPTKCTADTINSHLQKLRNLRSIPINLVLIDYLGLLGPSTKARGDDKTYSILGQITKELLAVAQENDVAIWLIHQGNRGTLDRGGEDTPIGLRDSGDSLLPMQDADLVLSFNQTEEESKREGEQPCRIYAAGGREISDKWCVQLRVDKETCRLFDAGETR